MIKVVVYATVTCPYCKMLKAWLEEKGIKYENKFVDEDQTAIEEMMQISAGHMGVPFTVVTKENGELVKIAGFDREKLQETLGA